MKNKNLETQFSEKPENDILSEIENADSTLRQDKKRKRTDIIARILSVVAALLLWFYVTGTESSTYEMTFTGIPVDVRDSKILLSETGLSLLSETNDSTVDVVLSGKRKVLKGLDNDDIKAYASVKNITEPGVSYVQIEFVLPNGVSLVQSSISTITAYVDYTTQKQIPIEVQIGEYSISDGYELGTPEFTGYDSITIEGAVGELNKIEKAVIFLDIYGKGNISDSFTSNKTVTLVDKDGKKFESDYVSITGAMFEKTSVPFSADTPITVFVPVYRIKTIPLRVLFKNGYYNDQNVKLTISPVSITVKGDPASVNKLEFIDILTIDEKLIFDQVYETTADIVIPEGLTRICGEDEPEKASVVLEQVGTSVKNIKIDLTTAEILYTGTSQQLLFDIISELSINVRCPDNFAISSSDVVVTIDASKITNFKAGTTYKVPVSVRFKGEASKVNVHEVVDKTSPYTVNIKLK